MEKILIVDDSMVNRKMLRKILEDEYEVIQADKGEDALEILFVHQHEIAAVLLDIIMPGMDGFDVLKKIRNHAGLAELPVIIQTENTDDVFETNALNAGATDFFSKPYKPGTIKTRLRNIINTRKMLNQISNLSSDELTGLMSLNQFYYEGSRWIAENPEDNFDVVAIDIVHFSIINDSKGVEGGNQLLRTIADTIREVQKDTRFIASRVYADRFIMLIRRREGYPERLIEQADRVTAEYADNINVHMNFGIYEITEKNVKLPAVCGRAFSATSLIKDYYGNKYAYYDENLHNQILYEEHINDDMEAALREKQFQIYFQPKYDLFTNSIAGAEALARWAHPQNGMIPPGKFIPIFEKNGFIVQLDQYVWEETACKISEWFYQGNRIVPVSVNISRIDIENIDVIEVLDQIIEKYRISPDVLHLEITESAYMQDTDKIIDVVGKLKDKGFIIEMDDFGSGYSSLNMLAKLPINILKLDMKFIQELENSVNAKTIIEYTIGLAKWMNLPVVAEGVETEEQLELLRRLECNYVQGYIFSKPIPQEEFERLLHSPNVDAALSEHENQDIRIYNKNLKYRMLIVEDIQLNRSIIRSFFEESFSIVEATNGRAAWEYLQSGERVDVILMDIYMPEMDGYELLEKIKTAPAFKKIPVLVVSGISDEMVIKKIYELGADAFLKKPFTAEGVIDKVRILLRAYDVLEDMSLWDLKDTVNNPWVKEVCEEIRLVHKATGKICRIEGDSIIDTADSFTQILSDEIYRNCIHETDRTNRSYTVYLEQQYLWNIQIVKVNGEEYLICFKISLKNAVSLA